MTYQEKQKVKSLIRTGEPANLEIAKSICRAKGLTENDINYFIRYTDWKPKSIDILGLYKKWGVDSERYFS